MEKNNTFAASIKQHITDIESLYKNIYTSYKPTKEEIRLQEFLKDIWEPRFDDISKNEKFYEIGVVQVFFHEQEGNGTFTKQFALRKLKPKRESNAPLWFVLYRLAILDAVYNLYLCPNIFYRDRETGTLVESNVIASNAYFIDIDEIESKRPIYNMDERAIKQFLSRKFPTYLKLKPKYITMSGRGLHLYFILEHTEKLSYYNEATKIRKIHKAITKKLIDSYGADKVCHNLNRYMRVPLSTNRKINIRSRLIRTDDTGTHSLSEMMETLGMSNAKTNGKAIADVATKIDVESKNKKVTPEKVLTPTVKAVEVIKVSETIGKETDGSKTGSRTGVDSLCSKRKRDLEKWFSWHVKDLKGSRHTFFWLYINNLKNQKCSYDQIKDMSHSLNDSLLEPLTDKELDDIIYTSNKVYQLKNSTIGERLGMTPYETELLECVYTEGEADRRKELEIELKAKRREERLKRNQQERLKRWAGYFEYMKKSPDSDYKKMASDFGISQSYCRRIRKAYFDYVA